MPLMKGHKPEVVSKNIKELIGSGRDPKQAIAIALSSARKYKKMADGGMVDDDEGLESSDDESAVRSIAELQDEADMNPSHVASPEEEDHSRMLAKALYDKSEEAEMMSDGGMVEEPHGTDEPDEAKVAETEEPVSVMPKGPGAKSEAPMSELSQLALKALEEKKRSRRFR